MDVLWKRKPGRFCGQLCALLQPASKTYPRRFVGALLNLVGSSWSCHRATLRAKCPNLANDHTRYECAFRTHETQTITSGLRMDRETISDGTIHHLNYGGGNL